MSEEKNTSALVPITLQTVEVVDRLAPTVAASHMFNVTPQQAAVVMLKGHELGFGLATAFEFIHVIEGKPGVSPKGMVALIQRSKDVEIRLERIPKDKDKPLVGVECWMKRKSTGIEHTARFTLEDAKRAGLMRPGSGWEKYPENMCQWRAIGFCADVVCPDLGGGMLRTEELGAEITPEGETVLPEAPEIAEAELSTQLEEESQQTKIIESSPATRPAEAQTVRHWLQTKARQLQGRAPLSDDILAKLRGLYAGKLAEALQNSDSKARHLFNLFVWGVESTSELTQPQLQAALRWLVEEKNETGDYPLRPYATAETLAIFRQAQIEAGQLEIAELYGEGVLDAAS